MRKEYLIIGLLATLVFSCASTSVINRERLFSYEEWSIEKTFISETGIEIETCLTVTFGRGTVVNGYSLSNNALRLFFADSTSIDVSLVQSRPETAEEF